LGCLGATIFVISQILPLSLPRVFHTPTLEVAVITSAMPSATLLPTNTPYPPNATYTPYPPNPTYTPYLPQRIPTVAIPTRIPTPMATVSLDTPPGTVLQRGQSWRQNGISLGIQEIRLCPNNSSVTFDFDLINYSDQEIIVTVIPDQFSVKDNSGRIWPLRGFSTYVLCPDPGSPGAQDTRYTDAVTPGDHFFAPGHRGWLISFEGPLTDSKVTSLTITVNGLSRISNARWSIPVGR